MSRHRALIVDDEPDILELIELTLRRSGVDCDCVESLAAAREHLGGRAYDFCLTDMRLGDGDGLELVELIQREHPETPVAVITAYGSMDTAISALKSGAFDFVSKPVELNVLRELVSTALNMKQAGAEPPRERRSRNELIGESEAMRRVRGLIARFARSDAPVFIGGESGTGKELVARLIHARSPRAEGPFVAVNCGAIPGELMESEFFGHLKGSFTGANRDKQGLFQAAAGGTLFLDEVAELPLAMQVKLLRAIQERAVRPVGAPAELPVNVRILSASHRPLAEQVGRGQFRQDLYYRLHVLALELPPLRERAEDIPELAEVLLQRLTRGQERIPEIDAQALRRLQAYDFPGNVRELENLLERAMALREGDRIRAEDLMIPQASAAAAAPPLPGRTTGLPEEGLEAYLQDIERDLLLRALEAAHGSKTAAAERLGLSFRSFRYRWAKLGLGED